MKSTLYIGIASVALLAAPSLQAQNNVQEEKEYWNAHTLLIPYRLPPAPVGQKPTYIDLDNDGDPASLSNGLTTTMTCKRVIWKETSTTIV